jgi:hypothetical protein
VEVRIVRCEKGPRKHHQPLDPDAWEANFILVFSDAPDQTWCDLFDELRQKRYGRGLLANFFTAHVEKERFTFYCHPIRLQSYVDRIGEIVDETNQLYRRMIEQADPWLNPEADFEELINAALDNLMLPSESDTVEGE